MKRKCTSCLVEKELISFSENRVRKDGLCTRCIECTKSRKAAVKKEWRNKNIDACRAKSKAYARANKEKAAVRSRVFMQNNPSYSKERAARSYKAAPDAIKNRMQARRAAKKQAIPAWAEKEKFFISAIFECAQIMSEISGYPWDVDHIVPLTSKNVCGLHSISNLIAIPSLINKSKGNRYWPEMIGNPR